MIVCGLSQVNHALNMSTVKNFMWNKKTKHKKPRKQKRIQNSHDL